MENASIQLAENVILIDAAYLDFVIGDMKRFFEPRLGRELKSVDLSTLVQYLAMEGEVEKRADNEVQVLLVYDGTSGKLSHCVPSDLKGELDGTAFRSPLGEFCFLSVPSEELVGRGDLYLDLLQIVLNASEVKKLILVPFDREYGEGVSKTLHQYVETDGGADRDKDVVCCQMEEIVLPSPCRWKVLGYALMLALGIRSEELQ